MTGQPNFFILGAPKCGTTSLARWLSKHPQVFLSPVKEPHFYCTDLRNRSIQSKARYRELFSGASEEHLAVGEASTWYLFSKHAAKAIEQEHPGSKYVVMSRDPVDMSHSLYHHNVRVLHEDQPSFEKAWRLQGQRMQGLSVPRNCVEPAFLQYYQACALGTHMRRLLEHVSPDRVLHVSLDDMKADPRAEYTKVLAFLGVEDDGRLTFPVANEARGHKSRLFQKLIRMGGKARLAIGINKGLGVARFNERAKPKSSLEESFRKELEAAFSEERSLLREAVAVLNSSRGNEVVL